MKIGWFYFLGVRTDREKHDFRILIWKHVGTQKISTQSSKLEISCRSLRCIIRSDHRKKIMWAPSLWDCVGWEPISQKWTQKRIEAIEGLREFDPCLKNCNRSLGIVDWKKAVPALYKTVLRLVLSHALTVRREKKAVVNELITLCYLQQISLRIYMCYCSEISMQMSETIGPYPNIYTHKLNIYY